MVSSLRNFLYLWISDVFFEENKNFSKVFEEVSGYYREKHSGFPFEKIYAILRYNQTLKNHILDFKYHRVRENIYAYEIYFQEMAEKLQGEKIDYITFPPVYWWRKLLRGYNQSELLARLLAKYAKVPVKDIFQKTKSTKKQSTLSASERAENLQNSIKIREEISQEIEGKNILFVDDVISTGSTAKLCGDLLKEHEVHSVI